MYQFRKKKFADSVAIYGRGRELFRPPTYSSLTKCDKNFLALMLKTYDESSFILFSFVMAQINY